jgi:PKD repeat protein
MKTNKLLPIIFVLFVFVMGCNKRPVADFTVNISNPDTDQLIEFTNTSADGKTYVWDFGDGTTSTEMSPSHSYSEAGAYLVELTVYSKKNKNVDSHAELIEVSDNLAAKMMHTWSYDSIATSSFVDGMLTSSSTMNLSDFFTIHTIEFNEFYNYVVTLGTDVSAGPYTLNIEEESFVIDGQVSTITLLTNTAFRFSSTNSTISGGVTYTDSNVTYLSR